MSAFSIWGIVVTVCVIFVLLPVALVGLAEISHDRQERSFREERSFRGHDTNARSRTSPRRHP